MTYVRPGLKYPEAHVELAGIDHLNQGRYLGAKLVLVSRRENVSKVIFAPRIAAWRVSASSSFDTFCSCSRNSLQESVGTKSK